MLRHLQYKIQDKYNTLVDDPSTNINIDESLCYQLNDEFTPNISMICTKFNSKLDLQDTFVSPVHFSENKLNFNSTLLDKYPKFKENLQCIKDDTDEAINSFIESGGRIRDLLYRMNTIDPIEREYMNRANQLYTFNDNFYNFTGCYRSSGRDDMVTNGLMYHETQAILLYLLCGSNISIDIKYKVYMLFNYVGRVADVFNCFDSITVPNYTDENHELFKVVSYKYFLLQSLYDSSVQKRISLLEQLSKDTISSFILNSDDVTVGSIYIDDKEYSLANLIFKLYKYNTMFEDEITYNMTRLPAFRPYSLVNIEKPKRYDFAKFYISESFRKIMHTENIIFNQLLIFSFMSFLYKVNNNTDFKLSNKIDDVLFEDRNFQRFWIGAEEIYSSEELFKLFINFIEEVLR